MSSDHLDPMADMKRARSLGDGPVMTRRSRVTDDIPEGSGQKAQIVKLRQTPLDGKVWEAVAAQAGRRLQPPFQPKPRRVRGSGGSCERGGLRNPR
jgi:hypothetical protein